MNDSICTYPWLHSYLGCRYERHLCCISKELEGYRKTSLFEFWNSDVMKEVRLKMLNGEKVSYCQECYTNEKSGIISLRKIVLENNGPEFIEKIKEFTKEDGSTLLRPTYFDYRTLQCNLQCLSCGKEYSSKHNSLRKKMWGHNKSFTDDHFERDLEFEDNMKSEIIHSLTHKECDSIYWAGGEPMFSEIHWGVVEHLNKLKDDPHYQHHLKWMTIHYNTNLTHLYWKKQHIPTLLEFFQPSIQASIDGTHETLEYLRDGAKWDTIEENWKQYYKKLNKNKQIGIAPVLSAPMLLDIDRYLDFFEPYEPTLYCHKYISNPENYPSGAAAFLDIRLYPFHIAEKAIDNTYKRFKDKKLERYENTLLILESYKEEILKNKSFFRNEKLLSQIKWLTINRDKFLITKRPFGELLKIIDQEAYEWYMSIPAIKK